MLNITHQQNLTALNTLHLQSQASNYCILSQIEELGELRQIIANYPSYLILGGGSNIILPEIYAGLLIHNQLRGVEISAKDDEFISITAAAGEIWDEFVSYCCQHGAYGLENLSLIPGTVGASPVQNIGAYGVEVKDFIDYVTVYDLVSGEIQQITNSECQFSYRQSMFKANPYLVVISVTFKLLKQAQLKLSYGDIAKAMAEINSPTPADLRQAIIQTRQTKLPDPAIIGNVGSFFHNPIINKAIADKLLIDYPKLPVYPTENPQLVKVSAGWLIDNLGLKGYRDGNVGVYAKQALVLVNHGGATQAELLAFAHKIQAQVLQHYGLTINIEPLVVK